MNPFRLTAADVMEISGVVYRLRDVLDGGYLLRQENSDLTEHYPYEDLIRRWVGGGLNVKYFDCGDSK